MKRELTCIVCPLGCSLNVNIEDGKILSVSGNTCPRGEKYAISECIAPVRMVTSTVKTVNGETISVKTDRPIPKSCIFDCMKTLNKVIISLPSSVGDVIIEDVFGCNIIATQNKK